MSNAAKYAERRLWVKDVLEKKELTATAKLVAMALAEVFSDARTGKAYPGLTRIAAAIAHGKKTAQRGVAELEALGLIDIRPPGRGRITNEYALVFSPEEQIEREWRKTDSSKRDDMRRAARAEPRRRVRSRKPSEARAQAFEQVFGLWQSRVAMALGESGDGHLILMEIGEARLRQIYRRVNARHLADDQAAELILQELAD